MKEYYVNDNETRNPGRHHEVHTEEHAKELKILNKIYLGEDNNCHDALKEAKKIYSNADGCKICCLRCHKG